MRRFLLFVSLTVLSLAACDLETMGSITSTVGHPELQPTPTLAVPFQDMSLTPTTRVNTGWESLRIGLERRIILVEGEDAGFSETVFIIRIDPDYYKFDVGYRPGRPLSLEQWQAETGALLVVNGGFFTEANEATGLVIVDGQASGESYTDFGGMFSVGDLGTEVRWLAQRPYIPGDNLTAALQSFPMLVKPDDDSGYARQDAEPARRTVVGQDIENNILFVIAASGTFTLYEMSQFLLHSDLDLVVALNLDGGGSSGLLLADPSDGISAYSLLPLIIAVYPR